MTPGPSLQSLQSLPSFSALPPHLWTIVAYGVWNTYRVLSHNRNRRACKCHACESPIPADHGHEVRRVTNSRFCNWVYFCRECFRLVRESNVVHNHPVPDWWESLDRAPRTQEERRAIPRPQGLELDVLIAEREEKLK